ncbi:MAG TPA: hypothetical protein VFT43_15295 [Candidatus Polarisedimenticolia bacterium]|nr:hypothetical protein [Candidatus Polarisedimenticolia bacterium]
MIALIGLFVLFAGPAMSEGFRAYKVRATANDLTTNLRALRYNAVANRTVRTVTINNQSNASPNQYTYLNVKGASVTVRLDTGVSIETTSDASINFNINGGTGSTTNKTVNVSGYVTTGRNDRYTVTVTPSGTVQSSYTVF